MKYAHVVVALIAFVIGWKLFLIQRDAQLFHDYLQNNHSTSLK
jgi:hypothetical protein